MLRLADISACVFASNNPGKIAELERLVAELGITIVPQAHLDIESAVETADSFVGNALIKARHAASRSGLPAIADDSGLVVDALGGRPGVHSARYAGPAASDQENVDKLLEAMRDVPDEKRAAAFHCAIVLVSPDDSFEPLVSEAEWRGKILRRREGAQGFGYDPVFFDPGSGASAAMLQPSQKNERSHRGQAMRQLATMLTIPA